MYSSNKKSNHTVITQQQSNTNECVRWSSAKRVARLGTAVSFVSSEMVRVMVIVPTVVDDLCKNIFVYKIFIASATANPFTVIPTLWNGYCSSRSPRLISLMSSVSMDVTDSGKSIAKCLFDLLISVPS